MNYMSVAKSDLLNAPSLPSGSGDGKSYKGAGAAFEGNDGEGADEVLNICES